MTDATRSSGRWTVILAGGVGSRFWPLSTPQRPKQLLPLVDERPLLANTMERLAPLTDPARTLVLTNAQLVDAVRAVAPELPPENVIAEPRPAGTAAALAWAALEVARRGSPEDTMLCVHADWAIGDPEAFRRTLLVAEAAARRERALVTVGIIPSRADTGFGYIQPGDPVEGNARRVARFVEKPNREAASRMMMEGYLWNSGIFVWTAGLFLDEIARHCPEVQPAVEAAGEDLPRFFAAVSTPIAVDVGVLERSDRVLVVPGDFAWDDVGTWAALHRVRAKDAAGNAASGAVHLVQAERNVAHAEGLRVVMYGVQDLVVVARDGLVMVTTRDKAADLKTLLDALPADVKELDR